MSKHRAADISLTLTPLALRLSELVEQSARQSTTKPEFAAVHDHIAQVADIVREAIEVTTAQGEHAEATAAARADALAAALERQADQVAEALDAGVRRMHSTAETLTAYLERRDGELESERDRILREVLEDFAASLHAREKRSVARRLVDAVDRRRDARDAAKWRREHGEEQRPARPQFAPQATEPGRPRVIDLDAATKLRRAAQRR